MQKNAFSYQKTLKQKTKIISNSFHRIKYFLLKMCYTGFVLKFLKFSTWFLKLFPKIAVKRGNLNFSPQWSLESAANEYFRRKGRTKSRENDFFVDKKGRRKPQ